LAANLSPNAPSLVRSEESRLPPVKSRLQEIPEMRALIKELMPRDVVLLAGVSGPWFSGWSLVVMKLGMIQKIRFGTSSWASWSF